MPDMKSLSTIAENPGALDTELLDCETLFGAALNSLQFSSAQPL
jgi:hypothetical protein